MDDATILLNPDGTYAGASLAALDLLGVSLDELLASDPSRFTVEAGDPEASTAFRTAWEGSGRPDIGGASTIRRGDGTTLRVEFAISRQEDGSFRAVLVPVPDSAALPTAFFAAGDVLSAWRAAERRLEHVAADSAEWRAIHEDIARLREGYQTLFQLNRGISR